MVEIIWKNFPPILCSSALKRLLHKLPAAFRCILSVHSGCVCRSFAVKCGSDDRIEFVGAESVVHSFDRLFNEQACSSSLVVCVAAKVVKQMCFVKIWTALVGFMRN